MKKIIACVLLLVVVAVGLCACGQNENVQENNSQKESEKHDPIAERKDKLEGAYETHCDEYMDYATLSDDRSSLVIDTNPSDSSYYRYGEDALDAAENCNEYLGLPDSLMDRFLGTRALDGTQTQSYGDYTVSWTYHPDNGLRIVYEVNYQ